MASEAVKDAVLPWDFFREKFESPEEHIVQWRKTVWKQIVRELREKYRLLVPDGLEPHWVGPGTAIFWTTDTRVQAVRKGDGAHNLDYWEETPEKEYKPSSPMPVGNANQLQYYLERKGFRLRPPLDRVEAQFLELIEAVESARAPEDAEPAKWLPCKRHNTGFNNWKAYIKHCQTYGESADLSQMPDDIAQSISKYAFYCAIHNFPSTGDKAMRHHLQSRHMPRFAMSNGLKNRNDLDHLLETMRVRRAERTPSRE